MTPGVARGLRAVLADLDAQLASGEVEATSLGFERDCVAAVLRRFGYDPSLVRSRPAGVGIAEHVRSWLLAHGAPARTNAIAYWADLTARQARNAVKELHRAGRVERVSSGIWRAA